MTRRKSAVRSRLFLLNTAEWPRGKAASSHGVSCRFDSDLCNFGALAHSEEHLFCKQKAAGSKPAGSIQIMSSEAKDLWGSLSP